MMIIGYLTGSLLLALLLFLNRDGLVNKLLIAAFLLLQCVFTCYEFLHKGASDSYFFKPDALAILLVSTLTIISIPVLTHRYDYIYPERDNPHVRGIYYGATVLLIMALTAAYLSSHIAVTWIFVEITTLASSALIFHRRNAGSIEATWKYIFVCSISLVLVFIGILFLSIALSDAHDDSLYYDSLLMLAPQLKTSWLRLAFIFIFIGYTAKLGLIPMYTAGIDAKDKAPAPSAALFSSVLMNVGFTGIFRFYQVVARTSLHHWANQVMMVAAILSVFVATVYMLKVKNIKRMLAYSSIEHMGIVVIGLAAGGIGYYFALLHLILHSFAKSSFFLQVGHLYKTFKTKNIYYLGQYFHYNVAGAIFILLAFLFITAMPPSGLFISELYIFKSLVDARYLYILIPMLILLTIIIWAMGKNIFKILFIPPVSLPEDPEGKVSRWETVSQYLLLGLVVYLGLNPPSEFVALINETIHSLIS